MVSILYNNKEYCVDNTFGLQLCKRKDDVLKYVNTFFKQYPNWLRRLIIKMQYHGCNAPLNDVNTLHKINQIKFI